VLLLLIGVPVALIISTFGLMAILLFFMSIPIVLCHWTYEWIKDFINRL
jgi:hypothetical protein